MTLRICVSFAPHTVTEALRLIEKAERQKPDLIEVRLDSLNQYDELADITQSSDTPLIATNRSRRNQGNFRGSEAQRTAVLLDAARNGFEYVDVELSTRNLKRIIPNLQTLGIKPIISFHNYTATPDSAQLTDILHRQLENGAYACKIVTRATRIEDNLTTLNFVSQASKAARIISFAMGDLGTPSRVLSPLFGAEFTIASLDDTRKTAAGQLTIHELRKVYMALGLT